MAVPCLHGYVFELFCQSGAIFRCTPFVNQGRISLCPPVVAVNHELQRFPVLTPEIADSHLHKLMSIMGQGNEQSAFGIVSFLFAFTKDVLGRVQEDSGRVQECLGRVREDSGRAQEDSGCAQECLGRAQEDSVRADT